MKFRFNFGKWGTPLAVASATALVVSVSGAIGGTGSPQYTGCLAKDGNLHNVNIGTSPLHTCPKGQQQITWSQTGPQGVPGTNGTSVTSATEPAGTNCPTGGSSFTSASGTTYACNGAKGDKGDTGATGPSNLSALQGSPCTFNGHPSSLQVSTNNTTGAVSMTCTPVYEVSVTMTGLARPSINILDDTNISIGNGCNALSCSLLVPSGDLVRVGLSSGNPDTGGGTPFTYTCPGEGTETANSDSGFYSGRCPGATFDTPITADYAVTVSASG